MTGIRPEERALLLEQFRRGLPGDIVNQERVTGPSDLQRLIESSAGIALQASSIAARGVEQVLRSVAGFTIGTIAARTAAMGPAGLQTIGPVFREGQRMVQNIPEVVTEDAIRTIGEFFSLSEGQQLASHITGEILLLAGTGGVGGSLVSRGLGMVSLSQRAHRLEKLGGLIAAAGAGAISEPFRVSPLPEEFTLLDPAGSIASFLMKQGVPEQIAEATGGAIVGGAIGATFGAVAGFYRSQKLARFVKKSESLAQEVSAVRRAGIAEEAERLRTGGGGVRKTRGEVIAEELALARGFLPRVSLSADEATAVGEQLTREQLILAIPGALPIEVDDALAMTALLRGNQAGVGVFKGAEAAAIDAFQSNLSARGVAVKVHRFSRADGTFDVLVEGNRPVTIIGDPIDDVTFFTRGGAATQEGLPTNVSNVNVSRASVRVSVGGRELEGELRQFIRISDDLPFPEDLGKARLILTSKEFAEFDPGTLRHLVGDVFDSVPDISSLDVVLDLGKTQKGGQRIVMGQFEAGTFKMPVQEALSKAQLDQFRAERAFEGQAAVLRDGTPIEYVGKGPQGKLRVRDPLGKNVFEVDATSVKLLPQRFEDTFTMADNLILDALGDTEKAAYRALRTRQLQLAAAPTEGIEKLKELAQNTAGVFVRSGRRGEIQLYDSISGDILRFNGEEAAISWIKEYVPIPPEMTVEEIASLAPGFSAAFFGGGGALKAGQLFPLRDYTGTFAKGARAGESLVTPTQGLLLDIERRSGVPVWTHGFRPVSDAVRTARNFESAWLTGGRLQAQNVKGVQEIQRSMRGLGKNQQEAVTFLLEMPEKEWDSFIRLFTKTDKKAVQAARDLKQWYARFFGALGLNSEKFLTEVMPVLRENAETFGNNVGRAWDEVIGTPRPAELEFFRDGALYGTMDFHDLNPFHTAARVLRSGTNEMILNPVWRRAMNIVGQVQDKSIVRPLAHFLEAVKGREFVEQVETLDNTVKAILEKLPGMDARAANVRRVGEDLVLNLLGLAYQGTMGFRLGLAFRNFTQLLQTTWTLTTDPGAFVAGAARALSPGGVEQAIRAGAISQRSLSVFAGEEFLDRMPAMLRKISEASLRLYQDADELNRAVSFHVARVRAENALTKFARRTTVARSVGDLNEARQAMLEESGASMFDREVVAHFLQVLQRDASQAADFLGVHSSNVTQFLYGRGNQPRWLRSSFGKMVGTFATWPMWYLDFVRRTTRNLGANVGRGAQLRFLGRLGIANAAIVVAGKEVLDADLTAWAAAPGLFYTGGPGFEVIEGLRGVVSGLPSVAVDGDDKFAQRRLGEGLSVLRRAGTAFVPNFYAVRDVARVLEAYEKGDPQAVGAALLGARNTREFEASRRAEAIEITIEGEPGEEQRRRSLDEIRARIQKLDAPEPVGFGQEQ